MASEVAEFEIYITSLTGKTIILETNDNETIAQLKEKIHEKELIPAKQQKLVYKSRQLIENEKTCKDYDISSGSSLNLLIRLGTEKLDIAQVLSDASGSDMQSSQNEDDYDDFKDDQKGDNDNNQEVNYSWYYLNEVNEWIAIPKFESLILCSRYNDVRDELLIIDHKQQHPTTDITILKYKFHFTINKQDDHSNNSHNTPHMPTGDMLLPKKCSIAYGFLDLQSKRLIHCELPDPNEIDHGLELLELLHWNKITDSHKNEVDDHGRNLPHPSSPFSFGTWFGELLYSFEWMRAQESKLLTFIMRENIDSFKLQWSNELRERVKFKNVMKSECLIPLGIGHVLFNAFSDEFSNHNDENDAANEITIKSCNDMHAFVQDFFRDLRHSKIVEIQLTMIALKLDSRTFFKKYLKDYSMEKQFVNFLSNTLSLKSAQIQNIVPLIKSAFQINTYNTEVFNDNNKKKNENDNDHNGADARADGYKKRKSKYAVKSDRRTTVFQKKAKATTSYTVWSGKYVMYDRRILLQQQHSVSAHIKKEQLHSTKLKEWKKKKFVKSMREHCNISIGPLNLMYDDLPLQSMDGFYSENEMSEFINNYLTELRNGNIERARNRCIMSGVKDDKFSKEIVMDSQKLHDFIYQTLKIRNSSKIHRLIPSIQKYAKNVYGLDQNDGTENKEGGDDKDNAIYRTWLSELCSERKTLTENQRVISIYFRSHTQLKSLNDLHVTEFQNILIHRFGLRAFTVTKIMGELALDKLQGKLRTKQDIVDSICDKLYSARKDELTLIMQNCLISSSEIDDELFLTEIVVDDDKLSKFLTHNVRIHEKAKVASVMEKIRKYLTDDLKIIYDNTGAGENNMNVEEGKEAAGEGIFGNKLGQWIGEMVHDRLTFLRYGKKIYEYILRVSWDSGILTHLGRAGFINGLSNNVISLDKAENFTLNRYDNLLREVWKAVSNKWIRDADNAFYANCNEVAEFVFEHIRHLRKTYISRLAVECTKDNRCSDANTFFAQVACSKTLLRNFIHSLLDKTKQTKLIHHGFGKEIVVEKITYFMNWDVENSNVAFSRWFANLIHDPFSIWCTIKEFEAFVASEKVNSWRANTWGKDTFIEKSCKYCKSMKREQSEEFFKIACSTDTVVLDKITNPIVNACREWIEKDNKNNIEIMVAQLNEKKINKQSFLSVTALNLQKLKEFITTDIGIPPTHPEHNFIIEKLRLSLRIHTNLYDLRFDDDFLHANLLYGVAAPNNDELQLEQILTHIDNECDDDKKNVAKDGDDDEKKEAEKRKRDPWIEDNMLELDILNTHQLSMAFCYCLMRKYEEKCHTIMNQISLMAEQETKRNGKLFRFNGKYLASFVIAQQKSNQIWMARRNALNSERIEIEKQFPWKYIGDIGKLEVKDLNFIMQECLMTKVIAYKTRMNAITEQMIDADLSGPALLENLAADQNVFMHRTMNCIGNNKQNEKLILSIYSELTDETDKKATLRTTLLKNQINKCSAVDLAKYITQYQLKKAQKIVIKEGIDGKKLMTKYKKYEFANLLRDKCGIGIGVGSHLYSSIKSYEFETSTVNKKDIIENVEVNEPTLEFGYLLNHYLKLDNPFICANIWKELVSKHKRGKLTRVQTKKAQKFMSQHLINAFYVNSMKVTMSLENIETLLADNFNLEKTDSLPMWHNFEVDIGEYFECELLIIIRFINECSNDKFDLAVDNAYKFIFELDSININFDKLYRQTHEIDFMIIKKKEYSETMRTNLCKVLEFFFTKYKESEQKTQAQLSGEDFSMEVIAKICENMSVLREIFNDKVRKEINNNEHHNIKFKRKQLSVFETLCCCKYAMIYISEIMKIKHHIAFDKNKKYGNDEIPKDILFIFNGWVQKAIDDADISSDTDTPKGFLDRLSSLGTAFKWGFGGASVGSNT